MLVVAEFYVGHNSFTQRSWVGKPREAGACFPKDYEIIGLRFHIERLGFYPIDDR